MNTTNTRFAQDSLPTSVQPLQTHFQRGFNLLELLVVMAIAAVLLTIGVPSMANIMDSVKLSSASNGLLSHLHLTRSEAIKRNGRVVMCKSADAASCATTGGWEQGWIIFHDIDNNGTRGSSEPILARQQALPRNLRVTGNLNVAKYVSFVPTGATKLVGGGFQAGTLTLCRESASQNEARQIILNAVGRPRVQKASISECV